MIRKSLLLVCFYLFLHNIAFSQPESLQNNKTPVWVGFPQNYFTDVDIRDARAAIEVWANNLMLLQATNLFLKTVLFTDIAAMESAFVQEQIDLVVLPILDYVKIENRLPLEPILIAGWDEDYGDTYLLLVNKEAGVTRLADLQDKELIIHPDGSNDIINYWQEVQLRKNNLPEMKQFYLKTTLVNKANQALLPVFFNQKTACIIKRRAFTTLCSLNPQIQEKMQILAESPRYIREVFCIKSTITEENRELMNNIMMSIEDDPSGKQILLLFKNSVMFPYKSEYINSIRELISEYKKLHLH